MKKIYITIIILWLALLVWYFFYTNAPIDNLSNEKTNSNWREMPNSKSDLMENTYNISKQYLALRYQTENILVNAKDYKEYDSWNNELTKVISQWKQLDENASKLESEWNNFSQESASINFWNKAAAYDSQEITNIFDKAPAGKKIATLAKHLWVDAKLANKILQNAQAQVEADAWNEAWDTFKKLETAATVIKDGCKVIGFVWWIAVSWWTAWLATASTLTKTAVIVGWADLTLEVTDDAAKIAMWDNNKISKIVSTTRIVTEPVANVLSIYSLPENLGSNFDKFNWIMIWLENFRNTAQEWKVVWIQLPVYQKPQDQKSIKISVLTEDELDKWIEDIWLNNDKNESKESIEKILWIENKIIDSNETTNQDPISTNNNNIETSNKTPAIIDLPVETKPTDTKASSGLEWTRYWSMNWTSPEWTDHSLPVTIKFLANWKIEVLDEDMFSEDTWSQQWNVVKVHEAESDWYYEFKLDWNKLTFIKSAWTDSDWNMWETYAWSSVDGGIYFTMVFTRK